MVCIERIEKMFCSDLTDEIAQIETYNTASELRSVKGSTNYSRFEICAGRVTSFRGFKFVPRAGGTGGLIPGSVLLKFYPDVKDDDELTIFHFRLKSKIE